MPDRSRPHPALARRLVDLLRALVREPARLIVSMFTEGELLLDDVERWLRSALAAVGHAFSDIENACRTQAADELAEYLLDKFPADFIPSLIAGRPDADRNPRRDP